MKRNEFIDTLEKWKIEIDPEARIRDYSIKIHENKIWEIVNIILNNQVEDSFCISMNDENDIIYEDENNLNNSEFINPKKFSEYIHSL